METAAEAAAFLYIIRWLGGERWDCCEGYADRMDGWMVREKARKSTATAPAATRNPSSGETGASNEGEGRERGRDIKRGKYVKSGSGNFRNGLNLYKHFQRIQWFIFHFKMRWGHNFGSFFSGS